MMSTPEGDEKWKQLEYDSKRYEKKVADRSVGGEPAAEMNAGSNGSDDPPDATGAPQEVGGSRVTGGYMAAGGSSDAAGLGHPYPAGTPLRHFTQTSQGTVPKSPPFQLVQTPKSSSLQSRQLPASSQAAQHNLEIIPQHLLSDPDAALAALIRALPRNVSAVAAQVLVKEMSKIHHGSPGGHPNLPDSNRAMPRSPNIRPWGFDNPDSILVDHIMTLPHVPKASSYELLLREIDNVTLNPRNRLNFLGGEFHDCDKYVGVLDVLVQLCAREWQPAEWKILHDTIKTIRNRETSKPAQRTVIGPRAEKRVERGGACDERSASPKGENKRYRDRSPNNNMTFRHS
jgi:hypothetical protein